MSAKQPPAMPVNSGMKFWDFRVTAGVNVGRAGFLHDRTVREMD